MHKSAIWIVCFLLSAFGQQTYAQRLSNEAHISLLTCVPGAELYSAFGHSAIRVKDPVLGFDRVYNYGTFDFNTPGFYLKFMRGKLNYKLNVETFRQFDYAYRYFKRSFDEQIFDLNPDQKQAVFDFLERNYLPENRYYLYDFFFDNCATRIRDVFVDVLGDSLTLVDPQAVGELTFRDMLDLYLKEKPWSDFGIDLGLGQVVDREPTHWEETFLPDYLAAELGKATIIRNGVDRPFVYQKRNLFQVDPPYTSPPWILRPIAIFGLLFLVVGFLTWRTFSNDPRKFIADGILFLALGIAGIIMLLLWFATDHTITAINLNVLWALPTHLVAGIMLMRAERPHWLKHYFMGTAILTLLLILGWSVNPQAYHLATLPILGIILLRSGVLYFKFSRKRPI